MRGLSLVAASGGHSSSRCAGLSLSWPLLLRSTSSRRAGSVIVAHGPSCSAACGIFPDQGSNLCPLHWQADSQPLHHQGSPELTFLMRTYGRSGTRLDALPTYLIESSVAVWGSYYCAILKSPFHLDNQIPQGSGASGICLCGLGRHNMGEFMKLSWNYTASTLCLDWIFSCCSWERWPTVVWKDSAAPSPVLQTDLLLVLPPCEDSENQHCRRKDSPCISGNCRGECTC